MATYRLLSGTHSRWIGDKKTGHREDYSARDPASNLISDLSDAEVKALGARVQAVGENRVKVEAANAVETADVVKTADVEPVLAPVPNPDYSKLLSKSVRDIETEVARISDVLTLDAIRQEEVSGKQRMGVLKVLKARKDELAIERGT